MNRIKAFCMMGVITLLSCIGVYAEEFNHEIYALSAKELFERSYVVVKNNDNHKELRKLKVGENQYYMLNIGHGLHSPDTSYSDRTYEEVCYLLMDQSHVMDFMMYLKGLKKHFPLEGEGIYEKYVDDVSNVKLSHHLGWVLVYNEGVEFHKPITRSDKYKHVHTMTLKTCTADFKHLALKFCFGTPKILGLAPDLMEIDPGYDEEFDIQPWFKSWEEVSELIGMLQKGVVMDGTGINADTVERLGKIQYETGDYTYTQEVLSYTGKTKKRFYIEGRYGSFIEGQTYPNYLWVSSDILRDFIAWLEEVYDEYSKDYKSFDGIIDGEKVKRYSGFQADSKDCGYIVGTFDSEMNVVSGASFSSDGFRAVGIPDENGIKLNIDRNNWNFSCQDPQPLKSLIEILKKGLR